MINSRALCWSLFIFLIWALIRICRSSSVSWGALSNSILFRPPIIFCTFSSVSSVGSESSYYAQFWNFALSDGLAILTFLSFRVSSLMSRFCTLQGGLFYYYFWFYVEELLPEGYVIDSDSVVFFISSSWMSSSIDGMLFGPPGFRVSATIIVPRRLLEPGAAEKRRGFVTPCMFLIEISIGCL